MYAALHLIAQKVIHHALALDPVHADKRARNNCDPEMAFAGTVITHMAGVTEGIVHNVEP